MAFRQEVDLQRFSAQRFSSRINQQRLTLLPLAVIILFCFSFIFVQNAEAPRANPKRQPVSPAITLPPLTFTKPADLPKLSSEKITNAADAAHQTYAPSVVSPQSPTSLPTRALQPAAPHNQPALLHLNLPDTNQLSQPKYNH